MPESEARRQQKKRYVQEKCDHLTINVPKGERETYKQIADEQGISVAKLVQYSIAEFAQRHTGKGIFYPQGDRLTFEQRQLIDTVSKLTPETRKHLIKFLERLTD